MVISFLSMMSLFAYEDSRLADADNKEGNTTPHYLSIDQVFQKMSNHSKLPFCEYSIFNNKTLYPTFPKFTSASQFNKDSRFHQTHSGPHFSRSTREPSCQTHIPQIFHQIYKSTKIPSQYTFSVASVARHHQFASDSTSLGERTSKHLFDYYFWTDDSVRGFIRDAKRFDPIFARFAPENDGTLFSDFA